MSSRQKHDKKTTATNGPVEHYYRAEQAALVYDSAAHQLQGNKAKTNFPNPNHLLWPKSALPPQVLKVRLPSYSGGDLAAELMFMCHPAALLSPEALELSLSIYSSGGYAVVGPMFMYHPAAPLPPKVLDLSLSSYYGGHVAARLNFMYHPGVINNDIHNNVNMSYETSVGESSNSWPEWDPYRARVYGNRDGGRGFPSLDAGHSADGLRKRPIPIRVRLAIPGPCLCSPELNLGPLYLLFILIGTGPKCDGITHAQRPDLGGDSVSLSNEHHICYFSYPIRGVDIVLALSSSWCYWALYYARPLGHPKFLTLRSYVMSTASNLLLTASVCSILVPTVKVGCHLSSILTGLLFAIANR
ncbi:ethylene-responsive transcription factor 4 [Tanacetum coccineum]